ncbi:MAG: hypothetical protein KF718_26495 [Polyangiaceae bacterium]|nr:hypothetical protein [Polyangiaceae bacterium]
MIPTFGCGRASCGKPIVVGDRATTARCPSCGREQAVPEVRVVSLGRSAELPESARLDQLRQQLDDPWVTPPGVIEFAEVLTTEVARAHRAWVERLERVQQEPHDPEAAHELLHITSSVAAAARRVGGSDAGSLARRGYWEATTEALWASPLRAFGFSVMVNGSVATDAFDDARAWLDRMAPNSSDLLADSCYRLSSAGLANKQGDYERVVQLLGRAPGAVPVHASMRTAAAVNQAHALEHLGDLTGAVNVLVHESERRHSSLVAIARHVHDRPKLVQCPRSFPIAMERALLTMLHRVPSRSSERGLKMAFGSLFVFGIAFTRAWDGYGLQAGALAALGGAVVLGGVALVRHGRRYRLSVLRGCIPVRGRVLSRTHRSGDEYVFEVVVERPDMPDQPVTMTVTLPPRVAAADHAGRTFDALWNPVYPTLFHKMTINVTQADIDRGKRAAKA